MAKDSKAKQKALDNLQSKYMARLWRIYDEAAREASRLCLSVGLDGSDLTEEMFSFDDFPATKRRVNALLKSLRDDVQREIVSGLEHAWKLANDEDDDLVNEILGDNVSKLTKEQKLRYFSNNAEALEAFKARQLNGMNLSDRVRRYTDMFKDNIEDVLDAGLREGLSSPEMAVKLKLYLKYPEKLSRVMRGADGRLHLSRAAKNFHPGRGVYRSSYLNALRLSVTETNMAYRTSDHLRIQDMDFVVGIEVKLSNNHTLKNPAGGAPIQLHDICDVLKGKYPKDFKFTGWHPLCRCHAETILKTRAEMDEDMERILEGRDPSNVSVNTVKDVPDNFKEWIEKSKERLAASKSLPYFMRDNAKYIGISLRYGSAGAFTGIKFGRASKKEALEVYEDLPAAKLSEEVAYNTEQIAEGFGIENVPHPMTFLQADNGMANVSWGKGYEFMENCQTAVVVHEARIRGLDVTSLGYDFDRNSVSYLLGEHFEAIWQHPKTKKTPAPVLLKADNFDTIIEKLENATKAKGRYHIGINMTENRGHIVTAERLESGKMIFYDAQCGTFIKMEEYAEREVEYLEVLKVDRLLLRRDLFMKIARRL